MKNMLANLLFPHYCCSCEEIGDILCDSCVYDIVSDDENASMNHDDVFDGLWFAGKHEHELKKLVAMSKYESCRVGCDAQARLLDVALPSLPRDVIVVAVPTIAAHIRQRGYGHSERIARVFAARRGLQCKQVLKRRGSYVQQGVSKGARMAQAKKSFVCPVLLKGATVLLIDDVYTTGSTVTCATQVLKHAGAKTVYVGVTARQTLD